MIKREAVAVLIPLLALILVLLFVVGGLDTIETGAEIEGEIIADAWEVPDSLVHAPAVGKDCVGLGLYLDTLEDELVPWRNRLNCETYSDIRIKFDGKEFLFSFDEFKVMIEASVPQQHFDNYDLSQ